jgi:hypothetical protein
MACDANGADKLQVHQQRLDVTATPICAGTRSRSPASHGLTRPEFNTHILGFKGPPSFSPLELQTT